MGHYWVRALLSPQVNADILVISVGFPIDVWSITNQQ
jgi:hypothetical protein